MLSDRTFFLLSIIPEHGLPEDQFPDPACLSDYADLVSRGFVRMCTLVPPGTESPRGLCYVILASAGRDALIEEQDRRNQNANHERQLIIDSIKEKSNNIKSFCRDLLIGVIGGLVVLAVEHFNEVGYFLRVTLHKVWSMLH